MKKWLIEYREKKKLSQSDLARMTRGRFVCHIDKNMLYCKK